ncbi:hypothetical protein CDS [Bradyrhizobium sp.]|nr:hypothetical protein CDS [Bradyrhizobium sp.]
MRGAKRRGNPDCHGGKILDCFASAVALRAMADKSLAMTWRECALLAMTGGESTARLETISYP